MTDRALPYLKAYAALVGSVATALLGVYAADTDAGKVLTVLAVVATAVTTWAVPNLDPAAEHQDESVQPPEPPYVGKHTADTKRAPTVDRIRARLDQRGIR